MNQITINFTPCSPATSYRVFYREVGDVFFIEWPDEFVSSPIVFSVDGPVDQPYEGYIVSVCDGEVFGPQVSWETVLCSELPPEGSCCDPEIISADAETTVPDESASSSGGLFLRLVFNIDESGQTLGDWNTLFGFTFDNVIYSAGGTIVDLYLSTELTIPANIFEASTTLVRVLDFSNLVVEVLDSAFRICETLVELDLPACEVIGNVMCFNCLGLTDVNLPLITVIPSQAFAGCTALINLTCPLIVTIEPSGLDFCTQITTINYTDCTFVDTAGMRNMHNLTSLSLPNLITLGEEALRQCNSLTTINLPSCTTVGDRAIRSANSLTTLTLPVCSALGSTTGDDLVFEFVAGETITFTLLTATATDGDVVFLQANNTVTLILV